MELFCEFTDLIFENNPALRRVSKQMIHRLQRVFESFLSHEVKYLVLDDVRLLSLLPEREQDA